MGKQESSTIKHHLRRHRLCALKNAIDSLFAEWNNNAAAFASYGGAGGARAVEQLRLAIHEEGKIHESIRIPESSGGDWMDLKCA